MTSISRFWNQLIEKQVTKRVLPYTLVGPERVHSLYVLAQRIEEEKIPGDVVECGVCNGGTAAVLAHFATRSRLNRTLWLFDSFQGMPETTAEDTPTLEGDTAEAHVGEEVGDLAQVNEVLGQVGADLKRVRVVPGWFQDTLPSVSLSQIALLNIDADWYESVRLCLNVFYDRVTTRGFVSIDDYGHWPGCRKAVDEFFSTRGLSHELHQVDYTAHWFRKE